MSSLASPLVTRLIALAFEEDMPGGDITTDLTVDARLTGSATIVARERLVVCGLPLIEQIVSAARYKIEVEFVVEEGEWADPEQVIARLRGRLCDLLVVERTVLNFLQRMSAVATNTRKVTERAGRDLTVLDTRKTVPGWRVLEKYAVRIGGGRNHRANLSEMILVKNNHIDANGGDIAATLVKAMRGRPPYVPVEVEVRDLRELRAALPFNPDVIMLDNFSDPDIRRALAMLAQSERRGARVAQVEISGGVRAERFGALKRIGVKLVSMSALSGHAASVDISMRITSPSRVRRTAGATKRSTRKQ